MTISYGFALKPPRPQTPPPSRFKGGGNKATWPLSQPPTGSKMSSSTTTTTPTIDYNGAFRRPLVFESQEDLYQWLAQSEATDFRLVDAVSFTLTLDEAVQSPATERSKLFRSLKMLPNVRFLTIYKLRENRHNQAHKQLYDDLLKQIPKLWPKLEAIAVHTDEHHLNFLRGLPQLRKLQFTGYSTASPMETATIFAGLRYLTDIELFPALGPTIPSQRTPIPITNITQMDGMPLSQTQSSSSKSETPPILPPKRYPSRTPTRLSLTREVLRNLRSLRSFTIREYLASNPKAPIFFTESFLLALASATNRGSLVRFTVELNGFVPKRETETRFRQWIASSGIRHLDMQWVGGGPDERVGHGRSFEPGVGVAVIDALPRSIVTVKWNGLGSGETLKRLSEKKAKGGMKELVEATVVVSEAERATMATETESSNIVDQAMSSLRSNGVHVYLV